MRIIWCSVVVTVLCAHGVVGMAEEPTEKPLGTVVVTATRTEAPLEAATSSISVVTEQAIDSRQAPTVAEALRDEAGDPVAAHAAQRASDRDPEIAQHRSPSSVVMPRAKQNPPRGGLLQPAPAASRYAAGVISPRDTRGASESQVQTADPAALPAR